MSDTIFDSFLSSVYGGGSAIELFDGGIDIIGGIDDITVESMFGGASEEIYVPEEDEIDDGNSVVSHVEVAGGTDFYEDPAIGETQEVDEYTDQPTEEVIDIVEAKEDEVIDGGLFTIGGTEESGDGNPFIAELKFTFDKPLAVVEEDIVSNLSPIEFKIDINEPIDKATGDVPTITKKEGASLGDYSLNATDVATMISDYMTIQ